ncbi:hypothetical protein [Nocardioides nitrophenolicus]|uniref:hypothetical protein n=1 Tax=Nocardioides nitrophenolicus TaxID=60489 RepID=UPI00195D486A|nr:hypothetical protein [Nocardioides nitrophenolicus]MBM7520304.1 hypothetical protein [Nocardioides nitrophenolicus]
MSTTTQAPPDSSERPETFAGMAGFLAHLEYAVTVDADEAPHVLRSLADHARRVRSSTFRRTTEMLDEGSREADRIVAQSTAQAERILRSALVALDDRVAEADRVTAAARTAVDIELRAERLDPEPAP